MTNSNKYVLLDNLFNLFLEAKYQPEDEELIKEWDIDIDNILKKNMALFHQLKTQARAELNKTKHERVRLFLAKLKEEIESKQEGYTKIVEEIVAKPRFAELQPMFRNLSSLSEKDKQSIVRDAKLLDLLCEIEERYKTNDDEE